MRITDSNMHNSVGVWIGPRDESGMPVYGGVVKLTIRTEWGRDIDSVFYTAESDMPDEDDLRDVLDGFSRKIMVEVDVKARRHGDECDTWESIGRWDDVIISEWDQCEVPGEIHEAVCRQEPI